MTNPTLPTIKTIAVFTGSLPEQLQSGNYVVIPLSDKDDNRDNGFAVVNISLESVICYCAKNHLESFLFSINNEGCLVNEYWEKQNPDLPYHKKANPYVKRSTDNVVVVNIDNANDYSVKIGDIRVSIPFFVLSKIDENLGRLERDGKISDKGSIIDHSMKSGQSPYLWRGAIYKGIL